MADTYTHGTPKQDVVEMEHGFLRVSLSTLSDFRTHLCDLQKKKKHLAEVTPQGVFQWRKTTDQSSPLVVSLQSLVLSRIACLIATDLGELSSEGHSLRRQAL